mgnify:CR=1 FL=1
MICISGLNNLKRTFIIFRFYNIYEIAIQYNPELLYELQIAESNYFYHQLML